LTLAGVASGAASSLARSAPASDHGHLLIATSTLNSSPRISSGNVDGRPLTTLGAPDCGTNRGAKLIRRQCSFDEAPANVERVIGRDWLRPSIDPEDDLAHSPEASPSSASAELPLEPAGSTNRKTLARARSQGAVAEAALAAVGDAADVLEQADVIRRGPAQPQSCSSHPKLSEVPFGVPRLCSRCG
jgi:hypothetical protein